MPNTHIITTNKIKQSINSINQTSKLIKQLCIF